MAVIEIQTIEGGSLDWLDYLLLHASEPKPNFRILDKIHGEVIGFWQEDGDNQ